MQFIQILLKTFWLVFLTVLTQIGGVVYVISLFTYPLIHRKLKNRFLKTSCKVFVFLLLYGIASFLIVPRMARLYGREPLPITEQNHLQPLNIITCLLNRHYVKSELKRTAQKVAKQMNEQYPGTVLNYLDANFPFFDGFPLVPHLSHSDGKKLDLAFCYIHSKTGEPSNASPSFIGYGVCEEPLPNEDNTAARCKRQGFWKYSFLRNRMSQSNKKELIFDASRTASMVNYFATAPSIEKIFIEPHLKTRLKLNASKIRFHGCHAVRHDDHLHVEMK